MSITLEEFFTLPVSPERAYDTLIDLDMMASCFPGAILDSVEGGDANGSLKIKLGPLSLRYTGTGRFIEKNRPARTLTFKASGRETRGAGRASASVRAVLESWGQETRVRVHVSLDVAGRPAQFARSLIPEVGKELTEQFVTNLTAKLKYLPMTGTGIPGASDPVPASAARAEPPAPLPTGSDAPYVTPLVRKLAEEHSVDLNAMTGTGVGGRIRKQDVLTAARKQRENAALAVQKIAALAQSAGTVTEEIRYEVLLGNETRVIDNSRSASSITRVVRLTREWTRACTVDMERATNVQVSGGVSLHVANLKAAVTRTLTERYTVNTGGRETFEEEVTLTVAPRTLCRIIFSWKETREKGVVEIASSGSQMRIPYEIVTGITFDQQQIDG